MTTPLATGGSGVVELHATSPAGSLVGNQTVCAHTKHPAVHAGVATCIFEDNKKPDRCGVIIMHSSSCLIKLFHDVEKSCVCLCAVLVPVALHSSFRCGVGYVVQ